MTTEFDAFHDTYVDDLNEAVAFAGKRGAFYSQVKADLIVALCEETPSGALGSDVLDVGCGIGLTDSHLFGRVGSLSGVDVSAASIRRAKELIPGVDFRVAGERDRLPYADRSFDFTFAICVLHHVPAERHHQLLREMSRITRPGGLVAIFEHNPANPLTRKVVRECAFDENAVLIRPRTTATRMRMAGLEAPRTRHFLFLPTAARGWRWVERRILRRVPIGAQYFVVARVPA